MLRRTGRGCASRPSSIGSGRKLPARLIVERGERRSCRNPAAGVESRILLEVALHLSRVFPHVELLLDARAGAGAQTLGERSIVEQPLDDLDEPIDVSLRDDEAGDAVDDSVGKAAVVGNDCWFALGHRLEVRNAQPFAPGRWHVNEDVERRHDLRDVAAPPDEAHRSLDTKLADSVAKRLHERARHADIVADHHEHHIVSMLQNACGRFDELVLSLALVEARDVADELRVIAYSELRADVGIARLGVQATQIDAGIHRLEATRRRILRELLAGGRVRDGEEEIHLRDKKALQLVVVGNARLAAEARRPGETRAENPSEVIVDVVVEQNEVDSLAPDQRPQAPQLWELCEQEPHSKTRRHLRALKKSPSRRSEEKSEGHVLLRLGGRREKVHAHTELADAPRIGSVVGEVERNDRLESRPVQVREEIAEERRRAACSGAALENEDLRRHVRSHVSPRWPNTVSSTSSSVLRLKWSRRRSAATIRLCNARAA